jgi:hypothetical protein
MPNGPVDPSALEGDDLVRWYRRSPWDINQERQAAQREHYNQFFGVNPVASESGRQQADESDDDGGPPSSNGGSDQQKAPTTFPSPIATGYVAGVRDLGIIGPFWNHIFLPEQSPRSISCEIEEIGPISLAALKDRICAVIQDNPDEWRDEDAVAGEDGPPRDEHEMLQELQERVRMAPSVLEIIYGLFPSERP